LYDYITRQFANKGDPGVSEEKQQHACNSNYDTKNNEEFPYVPNSVEHK
jgi:hypothetical protein